MLGIRLCVRIPCFGVSVDQRNFGRSISNSLSCSSPQLSFPSGFGTARSYAPKPLLVSCKVTGGSSGGRSASGDESDDEYLEAFVLVSETIRHYQLRKQGFVEESKWHSSHQLVPFYVQAKGLRRTDLIRAVGLEFLRRFQSPTVFLKISCDVDLLLPIIVGEFAIEKLMDALMEDENGECPNQFQLMRNIVGKLGYEVKMVRITERVVNTYYARIYLWKPGEKDSLSLDARPSDAINVAKRCKVPIYVNKQIVLSDAIKIVYGSQRGNNMKSVYDVSLDGASEGPDILAEELELVRNMNIAIEEERYKEAVMWRDKLKKLRML